MTRFVTYLSVFKNILTSVYLVEGLAWCDWPFTWWTDQLLSYSALHCWYGHLTRKIVPDMTYNVFGETLNLLSQCNLCILFVQHSTTLVATRLNVTITWMI